MDLLSSILRSCNAEKYIEHFKTHQVDSFTLKLLSHEDLERIGIQEEEHRITILKHIEKLQIPSEKKVNTTVDKEYVLFVLNQMSLQVHKHYALLTYNLKRQDVALCSVMVTPATNCLQNCFKNIEKEVDKFEDKIFETRHRKKRQKGHLILLPTLTATALALLLCRFYVVYSR